MTRKSIVIVEGAKPLTTAILQVLSEHPNVEVQIVEDIRPMETDGENIFYDPKMIESLETNMSDQELYGNHRDVAIKMINDRKLGEYKVPKAPNLSEPKIFLGDDLPKGSAKPAFLLERDHHIRKVRR